MRNIHKIFRHSKTTEREKRLCFEQPNNAPDLLSGFLNPEQQRVFESNEHKKKDFEEIEGILRNVIYEYGDKDIMELFDDPVQRKRMVAMVRKERHRIRFLPPNASGLAGLEDNKSENPAERMNEFTKKLEDSVVEMIQFASSAKEDLQQAKKDYPDSPLISEVQDMLDSRHKGVLLQSRKKAFGEIKNAIKELNDIGDARDAITKVFDTYTTSFKGGQEDPEMQRLKDKLLSQANTQNIELKEMQQTLFAVLNGANNLTQSIEENRNLLQQRQDALAQIAFAIMATDSVAEAREEINSIFEGYDELFVKLGDSDPLMTGLKDALLAVAKPNTSFEDVLEAMREVLIRASNVGYSLETIDALKQKRNEVDTALANVDEKGRLHVNNVFTRQRKYLDQFGDSPGKLISGAILEDGRFSFALFQDALTIASDTHLSEEGLKKEAGLTSASTLVLRGDAKEELVTLGIPENDAKEILFMVLTKGFTSAKELDIWKTAKGNSNDKATFDETVRAILEGAWDTTAFETYLTKNLNLHKTMPGHMQGIYMRSRLPNDVSTFFLNSRMKVGTGTLVNIAQIPLLTSVPSTESAIQSIALSLQGPAITGINALELKNKLKDFGNIAVVPLSEEEKTAITTLVKDSANNSALANYVITLLQTKGFDDATLTTAQELLTTELFDHSFTNSVISYYEALNDAGKTDVEKTALRTALITGIDKNDKLRAHPGIIKAFKNRIPDIAADTITVGEEAKDKLFELLAKQETANGINRPKYTIEKNDFIEVLSALLLRRDEGSNETERAEKATEDAEKLWQTFIRNFGSPPEVSSVTDVKLEKIFKQITFNVGDVSLAHHDNMRRDDVQDISWAKNIKDYAGVLLEDAKDEGPIWADFMKNFVNVVTDDGDETLLGILNRRRGLQTTRGVIEDALGFSTATSTRMERILNEMRAMHIKDKREIDGLDTSGAAVKSKEVQSHALMLAKSYFYAHGELADAVQIDSMDPDIQELALWMALNRQNPESEKDATYGLRQARAFLLEFSTAPNHLQRMQEAHEAFMGRSRLPEGQGFVDVRLANYYIECVARYQTMTRAPQDVYDSYIKSIQLLHDTAVNGGDTEIAINALTLAMNVYYKQGVDLFEQRRQSASDPALFNRQEFLRGYYTNPANITPEELSEFNSFNRKFDIQEENEGADNTAWLWNKHRLSIMPPALLMLAEARIKPDTKGVEVEGLESDLLSGSYNMDRWLNDGELEASAEPLQLILNGSMNPEGKDALIQAYIQGRNILYNMPDGTQRIMTREDALRAVQDIRTRLQKQQENYSISAGLGDDYERHFTNPLERVLRGSVETMQELWAGDGVDKFQLLAALGVGIWLIREAWKKGGQDGATGFWKVAKAGLIGLPLLVFANTAFRNRTGRDILGEQLLFIPKKQRESMLEQWRRRAVDLDADRYGVLGHNAGIAAIEQLTNLNNNITVDELNEWRMEAKRSVPPDYLRTKPDGLNISSIRWHLGIHGTDKEAAEVAFIAYESLCTTVAAMHKQTGTTDQKAQWGANYIKRRYIDFTGQYDNPEMQEKLRGRTITMVDVINNEGMVSTEEGNTILTNVESGLVLAGSAREEVVRRTKQGLGWIRNRTDTVLEFSGELYEDGKEYVFDTGESIYEWLRVTAEKGKYVTIENFEKTFRMVSDTFFAVGGTIVLRGPDAIEWVFDVATYGVEETKAVAMNIYRMLLTNGVAGPVLESLRNSFKEIFGTDIDAESKTAEYVEQLANYTDAKKILISQIGNVTEDLPADFATSIDLWVAKIASVANPTKFEALPATKKMLVFEHVKRQIFSHIIATRVDLVDTKGDDKDFTVVEGPFDVDWPKGTESFDLGAKAKGRTGELYQYLVSHYNPAIVAALMGNEQNLEGTMKQLKDLEPGSITGRFSSALLSAGIENILPRADATGYIEHELAAYAAPFLAQAEEKMNEDQFKQYKAYMDTLMTNVIMEVILESNEQRDSTDLELTIAQAKNLFQSLYLRRGISPNAEQIVLPENEQFLAGFEAAETATGLQPKIVTQPEKLQKLLLDKRKRWLLRGSDLEGYNNDTDTIETGDAAVGKDNDLTEEEAKKTASEDLGEDPDVEDVQEMVRALRGLSDLDKASVHKKFIKAFDVMEVRSAFATLDPEKRKLLTAMLAGLPKDDYGRIKKITDMLLPAYADGSAAQLAEVSRFDMRDRTEKGVETLFSRIAIKRLDTMEKEMRKRIGAKTAAQLNEMLTPSKAAHDDTLARFFAASEKELLDLYRMTNRPLENDNPEIENVESATDAVSHMLEFVLYRGDNRAADKGGNYGYAKLQKYLEDQDNFIIEPGGSTIGEQILGGNRAPNRMNLNLKAVDPVTQLNLIRTKIDALKDE